MKEFESRTNNQKKTKIKRSVFLEFLFGIKSTDRTES